MNLDSMTMARARRALGEAAHGFLYDPNVTLIDFGFPEHDEKIVEDEIAIRIHVRKKLSDVALESAAESGFTKPIPPMIGGFPTDVPEGRYTPNQQWSWWDWWTPPSPTNARATRQDPMRGGISISDENHNAYGTLGFLVRDRATGAEMMLSNWHVLVADWGARTGQAIYQPGRLDGGRSADAVATLTRDAMSVNLDAAVATLNGSRRLINDQVGLGPVRGVSQARLGMNVVKSGRRTGITRGRVTAVEGVARIDYNSINRIIRQVVTIEPRPGFESQQVSMSGDSGSGWLDEATMQAIGLHFAGSDFPERGLALDIRAVLEALRVDLVTTTGLAQRAGA